MKVEKKSKKPSKDLTSKTNIEEGDWEGRCKRCGLCCFDKIEDERGNIFYTQTPCRYFDVVSRECSIYDNRFEIEPTCIKLTPEVVPTLRWLHAECGYRE